MYVRPLKVVLPEIINVEEPVIGPEELREPETKREEPTVEEAEERKPPERVERPVIAKVDCPVRAPPNVPVVEAVIPPERFRLPLMNSLPLIVEDALVSSIEKKSAASNVVAAE